MAADAEALALPVAAAQPMMLLPGACWRLAPAAARPALLPLLPWRDSGSLPGGGGGACRLGSVAAAVGMPDGTLLAAEQPLPLPLLSLELTWAMDCRVERGDAAPRVCDVCVAELNTLSLPAAVQTAGPHTQ